MNVTYLEGQGLTSAVLSRPKDCRAASIAEIALVTDMSLLPVLPSIITHVHKVLCQFPGVETYDRIG